MSDRRGAQLLALGLVMDAGTDSLHGPALIHALCTVQASLGPADPLAVALRTFARDVARISRDPDCLLGAGHALFAAVLASVAPDDRAGLAVALSEMPATITAPGANVVTLGARRPRTEAPE